MAGRNFRNAAVACCVGVWVGFCPLIASNASAAPLAMAGHATIFDQAPRDHLASEPDEDLLRAELGRETVAYPTPETSAPVVIDTSHTYLYYVLGGGRAIRSQYRIDGTNDPTTLGKKISNASRRLRDGDAARSEAPRMSSRQVPQPGRVAIAFGIY